MVLTNMEGILDITSNATIEYDVADKMEVYVDEVGPHDTTGNTITYKISYGCGDSNTNRTGRNI